MADQFGIDVCSEEVLFRTVLEVCLRLHERWRLQELLATIWSLSAPWRPTKSCSAACWSLSCCVVPRLEAEGR